MKIGVLFVCLGNICRSPSAQGIFERLVHNAGLDGIIHTDSCGTAAFNIGKHPDPRAIAAARRAGYAIDQQIARQIEDADYFHFDYIVPMDRQNLINVQAWTPRGSTAEIRLLLEYSSRGNGDTQIPDPFYQQAESFDAVIATLEVATLALFIHISTRHNLPGNAA